MLVLRSIYIDVGDQKFISRSSDGFAFSTFKVVRLLAADDVWLADDCAPNVSSTSSLTLDTTDVVDVASRCTPSKLEKNQLLRPSVVDDDGTTEN